MTTEVAQESWIKKTRPTSTIKTRRKGFARFLTHQTLRRLIQFGVFAFIAFIAARHFVIGEEGAIVTASWEAYCPLGGLETLYKYLTTAGGFV